MRYLLLIGVLLFSVPAEAIETPFFLDYKSVTNAPLAPQVPGESVTRYQYPPDYQNGITVSYYSRNCFDAAHPCDTTNIPDCFSGPPATMAYRQITVTNLTYDAAKQIATQADANGCMPGVFPPIPGFMPQGTDATNQETFTLFVAYHPCSPANFNFLCQAPCPCGGSGYCQASFADSGSYTLTQASAIYHAIGGASLPFNSGESCSAWTGSGGGPP